MGISLGISLSVFLNWPIFCSHHRLAGSTKDYPTKIYRLVTLFSLDVISITQTTVSTALKKTLN